MVEAVFSESACGSLKYAQFFGRGEYGGGLLGIILEPSDGEPSEEEIARLQRRAEEEHRRKWERARPMGGRAQDVYGFSLGLSLGDISEKIPGPIRRQVLCAYCGFSPSVPGIGEQLDRWIDGGAETLRAVLERSAAGEPVRLWYSDQPDELCGFYWLLARLDGLEQCGAVSAVKLPRWDQRDNSVVTYTAWGDVPPGEWSRFLPLEQPISPILRRACANRWRELQEENAPLRTVLNGTLAGVPEDFYDSFIRRTLARMEREFNESRLIGEVIGRCQLGIGDGLIHRRIQAMVDAGELEALTQAAEGDPVYRRMLRKR
ncbi:DUF3658 domain-containing protein [Lawsonibacter sp. JLR.KK007]|jgi:hypothetical protein|uniref:DUF3658 domain-containing protein n=1 Tax=Lawsonibacter sp. JLR.KK007 TaxID=3114293 RepID=UPI002FF33ED5